MPLFLLFILCLFLSACSNQEQALNPRAAEINANLALDYLQVKQLDLAKEKLLLAEQQAPKNARVLAALAYYYQQEGQVAQAYLSYQRALHYAPQDALILNNYGVFLCRIGKYQTAIWYFAYAAQQEDNLHPTKAYQNAGYCALKIPDKKLAEKYFKRAMS